MKVRDIVFNKERRNQVLELRKQKEYEKILEIYGTDIYKLAASSKYKKNDMKKLLKEGKFEDIYRRYGEKVYNEYLDEFKAREVEQETGSKAKGMFVRTKSFLKKHVLPVVLSVAMLPPAGVTLAGYVVDESKKEQVVEYAQELETYNGRMNEYAQNVKNMNLTDIQTIMKVVDDMWTDIEGYGNPQTDPMSYWRLAFAEKGGIGVCRNMADHVTYVLNQINPKYNARNFGVTLSSGGKLADIDRNIIETNETVEQKEKGFWNGVNEKMFGNHMVTAVDIPDEKVTLIVDSTNPSIGVYKDGKITMFWSEDGKGIELAPSGQAMIGGIDGIIDLSSEILKSFLNTNYSIEELREKWGLDAQNLALSQVREMQTPSENKENKFDERYRIAFSDQTSILEEIASTEQQVKQHKTSLTQNKENSINDNNIEEQEIE